MATGAGAREQFDLNFIHVTNFSLPFELTVTESQTNILQLETYCVRHELFFMAGIPVSTINYLLTW